MDELPKTTMGSGFRLPAPIEAGLHHGIGVMNFLQLGPESQVERRMLAIAIVVPVAGVACRGAFSPPRLQQRYDFAIADRDRQLRNSSIARGFISCATALGSVAAMSKKQRTMGRRDKHSKYLERLAGEAAFAPAKSCNNEVRKWDCARRLARI